jgi:hypothetical protein
MNLLKSVDHNANGAPESVLALVADAVALLRNEGSVQLLLLQRETWTDHYSPSLGQIFDELRNEGSPGTPRVSTQGQEQLECRDCVRVALDGPDFSALLF